MWGEVYLAEELAYAGIFYASIISSTMFFCSTIDFFFPGLWKYELFHTESLMFLSYLFLSCLACIGFRS